ncbi:MAG: rRNA maturation RNase YbeY [Oscillospiraceae bacterium]|jgi:probable rRNA maturation factor|nr:rRNA maturation RNase YbeY [Oscillospiraceae bacterium]
MGGVKVVIGDRQKKVKLPVGMRLLIRKCCAAVLIAEDFDERAIVAVSLVDDEEISFLNGKYRGKDLPTDVLSFPLSEEIGVYDRNPETGEVLLGDIIMSLERAERQSVSYGHSFQREVAYLTVHSLLHLFGYTHKEGALKKLRMREKEETIMTRLGLPGTCSYVVDEFIQTRR